MSISEIIVKLVGIVLAVVGLLLVLAAVGLDIVGGHIGPWWLALVLGFLLIGAGVYIIRGGTITA